MNLYINAVEQRAGNFSPILFHLRRCALASAGRMPIPAAFARIHRTNQHEFRRIRHAPRRAHNGNRAIFQRLAQNLQGVHAKLRQLLLDVSLRRQQTQQNRQVIHRTLLANVRRRQIYRLARRQQCHADAARRRRDAFLGLLDRRARQTDQLKRRQAVDQPAFDGHEISFYAVNARGKYSCYHAHTPPVFVFYIVTQPKSLGNITAQL